MIVIVVYLWLGFMVMFEFYFVFCVFGIVVVDEEGVV